MNVDDTRQPLIPAHIAANFDASLVNILPSYILSSESLELPHENSMQIETAECPSLKKLIELDRVTSATEEYDPKDSKDGTPSKDISIEALERIHDFCLENSDFEKIQLSSAYPIVTEPSRTVSSFDKIKLDDVPVVKEPHVEVREKAFACVDSSVAISLDPNPLTRVSELNVVELEIKKAERYIGSALILFKSMCCSCTNKILPSSSTRATRRSIGFASSKGQIPTCSRCMEQIGLQLVDMKQIIRPLYSNMKRHNDGMDIMQYPILNKEASYEVLKMFHDDTDLELIQQEGIAFASTQVFEKHFQELVSKCRSQKKQESTPAKYFEDVALCGIELVRLSIITTLWQGSTRISSQKCSSQGEIEPCPFFTKVTSTPVTDFVLQHLFSIVNRFSRALRRIGIDDKCIISDASEEGAMRRFPTNIFNAIVFCYDQLQSVIENIQRVLQNLVGRTSFSHNFSRSERKRSIDIQASHLLSDWLTKEKSEQYMRALFSVVELPSLKRAKKAKLPVFYVHGIAEAVVCALSEFLSVQLNFTRQSTLIQDGLGKLEKNKVAFKLPSILNNFFEIFTERLPFFITTGPLADDAYDSYRLLTSTKDDARLTARECYTVAHDIHVGLLYRGRYITSLVLIIQGIMSTMVSYLVLEQTPQDFRTNVETIAMKFIFCTLKTLFSHFFTVPSNQGTKNRGSKANDLVFVALHQLVAELYFCMLIPKFPISYLLFETMVNKALVHSLYRGLWWDSELGLCSASPWFTENEIIEISSVSVYCLSGIIRMVNCPQSTLRIQEYSTSLQKIYSERKEKSEVNQDLSEELQISHRIQCELITGHLKTLFYREANVSDPEPDIEHATRDLSRIEFQGSTRLILYTLMTRFGNSDRILYSFDTIICWLTVWFQSVDSGTCRTNNNIGKENLCFEPQARKRHIAQAFLQLFEKCVKDEDTLSSMDSMHVLSSFSGVLECMKTDKCSLLSDGDRIYPHISLCIHKQLNILDQLCTHFHAPNTHIKIKKATLDAFASIIVAQNVSVGETVPQNCSVFRLYEMTWRLMQSALLSECTEIRSASIRVTYDLFVQLLKDAVSTCIQEAINEQVVASNKNSILALASVSSTFIQHLVRNATKDQSSTIKLECVHTLLTVFDHLESLFKVLGESTTLNNSNILENTFGVSLNQSNAKEKANQFIIQAIQHVFKHLFDVDGSDKMDVGKFSDTLINHWRRAFHCESFDSESSLEINSDDETSTEITSTTTGTVAEKRTSVFLQILMLLAHNMDDSFTVPDYFVTDCETTTRREVEKMHPIIRVLSHCKSTYNPSLRASKEDIRTSRRTAWQEKCAAYFIEKILWMCILMISCADESLRTKVFQAYLSNLPPDESALCDETNLPQFFSAAEHLYTRLQGSGVMGFLSSTSFLVYGLIIALREPVKDSTIKVLYDLCHLCLKQCVTTQHQLNEKGTFSREAAAVTINLLSALRFASHSLYSRILSTTSNQARNTSIPDLNQHKTHGNSENSQESRSMQRMLFFGKTLLLQTLTHSVSRYSGDYTNALLSSAIYFICEMAVYAKAISFAITDQRIKENQSAYLKSILPLWDFSLKKVKAFIEEQRDTSANSVSYVLRYVFILSECAIALPFSLISLEELTTLSRTNFNDKQNIAFHCFETIHTLLRQIVEKFYHKSDGLHQKEEFGKSVCMIFDRLCAIIANNPENYCHSLMGELFQSATLQYLDFGKHFFTSCSKNCKRCEFLHFCTLDDHSAEKYFQMRALRCIADCLRREQSMMEASYVKQNDHRVEKADWMENDKDGFLSQKITNKFLDVLQSLFLFAPSYRARETSIEILAIILEQAVVSPQKFVPSLIACFTSRRALSAWKMWVGSKLPRKNAFLKENQDTLQFILTKILHIFVDMYTYASSEAIEANMDIFRYKSFHDPLRGIWGASQDWKFFRKPVLVTVLRFLTDSAYRSSSQFYGMTTMRCRGEACLQLKCSTSEVGNMPISIAQYVRFMWFTASSIFTLAVSDIGTRAPKELQFVIDECDKMIWITDTKSLFNAILSEETSQESEHGALLNFCEAFALLAVQALKAALSFHLSNTVLHAEDLWNYLAVSSVPDDMPGKSRLLFESMRERLILAADKATTLFMKDTYPTKVVREIQTLHDTLLNVCASYELNTHSPRSAKRKKTGRAKKKAAHYVDTSSSGDYEYP